MTRRWFSKLITAAPIAAPLAAKTVAEDINCGVLDTSNLVGRAGTAVQGFPCPPVPPDLFPGSMEFRSTSKSAHYKWLEKTAKQLKDENTWGKRYQHIKQHDNRVALNYGTSVERNRKTFTLKFNSNIPKWQRDTKVKLWNLRRKTTLAEEWESAKTEIMEACSIEVL